MKDKKIAAPKEVNGHSKNQSDNPTTRPPSKLEVVLVAIVEAGNRGMNTLEAKLITGDTCLHTTISTLANRYGFLFYREREEITNRAGTTSRFTRYSLPATELNKARIQIDNWRQVRGALPLFDGGQAA